MRTVPLALVLATAAAAIAAPGAADEGADAIEQRAEREDAAGEYAKALADYRAAIAADPSARWVPKASTRSQVLATHAEGDFAPFARLEAAQRDPHFGDDPARVDDLARAADAFPAGATRGEARMVCADAWLRAHRRREGEDALQKVIDDTSAEPLLRRQAAAALVTAIEEDGDPARARSVARSLGTRLDPRLAKRAELLARRAWLHRAALVDVALVALLAIAALARAAARGAIDPVRRALKKGAPLAIVFAAYVALAGGALASGYESGNATPFLAFGASLLPIAIAARAWSAAGSSAGAMRALRALACASAVFAAAFLVLEAVNADYLEGFGL